MNFSRQPFFYDFLFIENADMTKHLNPSSFIPHLYQDLPPIGSKFGDRPNDGNIGSNSGHSSLDVNISASVVPSFGSKLGLLLPDPAPEVAPNPDKIMSSTSTSATTPFGVTQQSQYFFLSKAYAMT